MRATEMDNIIKNNIDKLRILQEGYYVCYYVENKRIMYSIKSRVRSRETFNYLGILWGPISSDYIDTFIERLEKYNKYEDFINSVDPFIHIWNSNLLYKMINPKNNFFKSDNEYSLCSEYIRDNRYLFCLC